MIRFEEWSVASNQACTVELSLTCELAQAGVAGVDTRQGRSRSHLAQVLEALVREAVSTGLRLLWPWYRLLTKVWRLKYVARGGPLHIRVLRIAISDDSHLIHCMKD